MLTTATNMPQRMLDKTEVTVKICTYKNLLQTSRRLN
jgi:hypothetical protein